MAGTNGNHTVTRIALQGGSYAARDSAIAAQACINLMLEHIPRAEGEPEPAAHILTPGLKFLVQFSTITGLWRGMYRATTGNIYAVVGRNVFKLVPPFTAIPTANTIVSSAGPVSMSDNGVSLLLVDGTAAGYIIDLVTFVMTTIADPAFYGGNKVDCLDGFFVLNKPNTDQWYISSTVNSGPGGPFNNPVTWNALDIAATTTADQMVSLIVNRRELWLFGRTRTEIWSNVGAADFPFQIASGGIEQGCVAAFSVVKADGLIFWLSRSREGQGMVMQGANYASKRISTHGIEAAIRMYGAIDDAIGWTYQIQGHTIYVLTFPTGNATWCYDLATQEWHQWSSNGGQHLGICHAESDYGGATGNINLVGDFGASGNLYSLDPATFTDNTLPIQRTRAFPHMSGDGNRVSCTRFIADMLTGTIPAGPAPLLTLDWSNDRGQTFSAPRTVGMGAAGSGFTSLSFRRCGLYRDRVWRLTWNAACETTLLGAFVEAEMAAT